MEKSEIISVLNSMRPVLEREGVAHIEFFGSQARGDAGPNSDLDVLIDVNPEHRFSILNLIGVEQLIQEATGIPVNAFMQRSLDMQFLNSIRKDKVKVF